MKPPPFEYHAPATLDAALALLSELDDAKVLAGGQSLVPLLSLRLARPAHLVDVNGIGELAGIETNGGLRVRAATRQRAVERSEEIRARWPIITEALEHVGHPPIRNRGTFGGSVAHADPAAELPAVALALDAEIVAHSVRGERVIPARDFFVSIFETALAEDELLTEIRIPAPPPGAGMAFHEVARRHGDFALVGAAAVVTGDDARIVFSGVGLTPIRVDVRTQDGADQAAEALSPPADIHGSSAYRKHLARVVATRALTEAIARCT